MAVGVDDVEKADDVGVVHLFEERDLADGGRGHAFVFGFEADLLEGDDSLVLGGEVARFVNNSVCSCLQFSEWAFWPGILQSSDYKGMHTLSNLLQLLVVLHCGGVCGRASRTTSRCVGGGECFRREITMQ